MPNIALLRNDSRDFAVPDQAAAATALATGIKVNNQLISITANGKSLRTILELARERGRSTGLVTNGRLADPTAAAFYAHASDQHDTEAIARQLVERNKLDLAIGGGAADFLPEAKNGRRRDGRDLLLEARRDGSDVVRTRAELEAIPAWRRPKLIGVFREAEMRFAGDAAGTDQPSLSEIVRRSIELLQFNTGGYVLIVDAALARKAAQENNAEAMLGEIVELDRAVAVARKYVGRQSTVIVTGDSAVGGLSLNGYPFRKDSGIALLGLNSSGDPWFTWATGPNGAKNYGASRLATATPIATEGEEARSPQEPAAFYAQPALNTADAVLATGTGLRTDGLHGFIDNTAIFEILRDCL
jgi:alkaline phosphatase